MDFSATGQKKTNRILLLFAVNSPLPSTPPPPPHFSRATHSHTKNFCYFFFISMTNESSFSFSKISHFLDFLTGWKRNAFHILGVEYLNYRYFLDFFPRSNWHESSKNSYIEQYYTYFIPGDGCCYWFDIDLKLLFHNCSVLLLVL